MTDTRWYLERAVQPSAGFVLVVERVSDEKGYCAYCHDRREARWRLPYLRHLAEEIGADRGLQQIYDPVDVDP